MRRCRNSALAVSFLRQHPSTVLVTVDVGFNDMVHCLGHHEVDEACVDLALANVRTQLPQILAALRSGGRPASCTSSGWATTTPIWWRTSTAPAGKIVRRTESRRHHPAQRGAPVGLCRGGHPDGRRGGRLRHEQRSRPPPCPTARRCRSNVARTCALTWACVPGPLGPQQAPERGGLPAHQRGHQRRGVKPLTGLRSRARLEPTSSCGPTPLSRGGSASPSSARSQGCSGAFTTRHPRAAGEGLGQRGPGQHLGQGHTGEEDDHDRDQADDRPRHVAN